MFTHAIKSASAARYSTCDNSNAMKNILIAILNVDIWILLIFGRCLRKAIRILKPILEAVFIMSIGAGLLLIYGLIYMPNNYDYLNNKAKSSKMEIMAITDVSNPDVTFVERELIRLRNKALNLEMSLNKMNSQLHIACKYVKYIDDNLPDFASEAAGGSVIGTPDTESYFESKHYHATIFGIPIWRPNYFTPRKVIQPWTQAGECWAFRGANGNIEIELAHLALLDRVTLEHIPVSISLTGSIDSAPKDFRVLGKFRDKYLLLDTFMYDQNGAVSQTFQITNDEMKKVPFKIIMLQVFSNWGNPEYTCIYRFKVHGKIYDHYSDSLSSEASKKNDE
ncbi:hypothetical protein PV327_008294 [Microctonus hyperodae]|uniref:SUN domain-containing protein n=1 Tax=Microctonus hyperodae TaxID=165561 RepID=A0AA39KH50_MICHY|nr:hypothetical protein PV327_008294 [Microctonus hyperodae]